MKKPVRNLKYQEIREILDSLDKRVVFEKTNVIPDKKDLHESLAKYVQYCEIENKSVLGIDIYKYSSFGEFEQTLIPFLFKTLFRATIKLCLRNHQFIFQGYTSEEIEDKYISTGDGGFLIFDTPLHSLLFASNFAVILRAYNAFHFFPKLRKIIGGISQRYAITYDKVYSFEGNFYGRAIINNARILNKDTLNRCLMDEYSHRWFTINIDGLENLQIATIEDITNIFEFKENYDLTVLEEDEDEIFEHESSRRYGIINSDVQKIGIITSKETDLSIYNLHLQVSLKLYNDDDPTQTRTITVSLGNLNTSGI